MSTMKEKALYGSQQLNMPVDETSMRHVPEEAEDVRVVRHVCLPAQGFSFLIATDTLVRDELNHFYRIRLWNCSSCGRLYWNGHKVDIDSNQAYQVTLQDIERYNSMPVDYSSYGSQKGMSPEIERFYMMEGMYDYGYTPEQYVQDLANIDPRTVQRVENENNIKQKQKVDKVKSRFTNIERWLGR